MTIFPAGLPVRTTKPLFKGKDRVPAGITSKVLVLGTRKRGLIMFTADDRDQFPNGLTLDLPADYLEPI